MSEQPRHCVAWVPVDTVTPVPVRSPADRWARRVLRLPEDGPKVSIINAQNAFSASIAISATRCLFTYIFVPFIAPLIGLHDAVGPAFGLAIGLVSMIAIFFASRRFFAADHKWRWYYASLGAGVFVLLIWQAVVDLSDLLA